MTAWLSDPEVYRYWGRHPPRRDVVADHYTNRRQNVRSFIIESEAKPVGYLQYHQFEESQDPASAGIDMFLIPGARRQGIGADALQATVEYLKGALGVRRVTVDPLLANPASIAFWEKCGFRVEKEVVGEEGQALLMELRL